MIDMTDVNVVKGVIDNVSLTFNTESGKEVMRFLEQSCGWYESIYDPSDTNRVLLNAGRREVLATIKTLLKLTPDEVVALVKSKEGSDG